MPKSIPWPWSWKLSLSDTFNQTLESLWAETQFSYLEKSRIRWSLKIILSPTSIGCLLLRQFVSVTQSSPTLVIAWTAARQASLSIINPQSLLKLMSIESVIPSNHLILFCPLLLLSSLFLLTFHQGLVISYDCYEAVPGNLAHRNPDFISSRVYTV